MWRGKWHIAQGNKNSQGKYNATKHEVSKECIGLESKKKGDSDFDIDRPPNIAKKYSISCTLFLFLLCHKPLFDIHLQFTSHMNVVIYRLKANQDPSQTQK